MHRRAFQVLLRERLRGPLLGLALLLPFSAACSSSEVPLCLDRVDIAFVGAEGELLTETNGHVRLDDGTEFDFTCPKPSGAPPTGTTYYCLDEEMSIIIPVGTTPPQSLSIFVQTADGRLGTDIETGLDYSPSGHQHCVKAELTLELR